MPIKVAIGNQYLFMSDEISISFGLAYGEGSEYRVQEIARVNDGRFTWERIEGSAYIEPSIRMTEAMARALLDELQRYFHPVEPPEKQLRSDYVAERARVDNLLNTVSLIAMSHTGVGDND